MCECYSNSETYLSKRFDLIAAANRFHGSSIEDYMQWKANTRARLAEITGMPTMIRCDPNPKILSETQCDGYKRIEMTIETEPSILTSFFALIPDGLEDGKKYPAIVATHGHASCGKLAVAGVRAFPELSDSIDQHNYDYGVQYVKEGFIVFCPDARGFGPRRESVLHGDEGWKRIGSTCAQLNSMAMPLGQTVTGMWVWDLMRLVDYIQTREDVDPQRIGCAGLSGGGLQSLWLSAMDDRIQCSVVSGYFYGYKQALLEEAWNCSCNYVPHLWETVDMGDIGALIAPRPFLVETGDEDDLNGRDGVANVTSQLDITRKAYALFDSTDKVYHDVFHGPHRWNGVYSIPWMKKYL